MRKVILGTMFLAVAGMAMTSCKKGENDPFISLKSRKGRLSGDWEVTNVSITETHDDSSGNITTTTTVISDGTMTQTQASGGSSYQTIANVGEFTMKFEKDGSYEQVMSSTVTRSGGVDVPSNYQTTETNTTNGTWVLEPIKRLS